MEDLALIKAVNHLGSFGKNFVMFMKKTELLFTDLGGRITYIYVYLKSN